VYAVQLIVNDGSSDSAPRVVVISTGNVRPVADAGSNQIAQVGQAIVLDGTASHDANGDPLSYEWALLFKPVNSAAALGNVAQAKATLTCDVPGTFVIAGSGEAKDGGASYRESTVRLGDVSIDGMRDKVRFVVDEMARRLAALGFTWSDATSVQAYTPHDIGPLVRDELFARGAGRRGLNWDYARPPIVDIEFEMDVRRPVVDRVLRT